MKRQIIKTRPQRPYVVARILIAALIAALVAAAGYYYLVQHGKTSASIHAARTTVRQDFAFFARNPQTPVILT